MSSTPDNISFMGMSSLYLPCLVFPTAYTQRQIQGGRGRSERFLIATNKHTSPWVIPAAALNRRKIMQNTCWWQSCRFTASIIRLAIQKRKKKGARSVAASRQEPAQVVVTATEFFKGSISILSLSLSLPPPSRVSRSPAKSRVSPYGRPHSKRRATTQFKEKSTSSSSRFSSSIRPTPAPCREREREKARRSISFSTCFENAFLVAYLSAHDQSPQLGKDDGSRATWFKEEF